MHFKPIQLGTTEQFNLELQNLWIRKWYLVKNQSSPPSPETSDKVADPELWSVMGLLLQKWVKQKIAAEGGHKDFMLLKPPQIALDPIYHEFNYNKYPTTWAFLLVRNLLLSTLMLKLSQT